MNSSSSRPDAGRDREINGVVFILLVVLTGLIAASPSMGGPVTTELSADTVQLSGPALEMGLGSVRTYMNMVDGRPHEIGVALSQTALMGLPANHAESHGAVDIGHGMFMYEYVLDLPQPNPTPYRKVVLNWNPGGHEPHGIYDTPHFDFHFQLIDEDKRHEIVPDHPRWEVAAEIVPEPRFMPPGYAPAAPAVPLMGLHWLDPRTPELNGHPFTQTFIFGTWDGEVIFAEPMITKAFLESRPDFTAELPVPEDLGSRQYHPSSYRIFWDARAQEYRVSLGGLVTH